MAERIRASSMRFAITGATGWLGRALAECLASALGPEAEDRLLLFAGSPRELRLDAGPTLAVRPLAELRDHDFDGLAHYAFITREKLGRLGWERYVASNVAITSAVLDAIARRRPSAVVYASSGAVHAAAAGELVADLQGDPYGTLKHLDELALRRAGADRGARTLVLRVFAVSGPWIAKPRGFALSDLILQVASGGPVVIRAAGPVIRSFVAVEDLALVAAAGLVEPAIGRDVVLDAAGEEAIEVGELARRIATVLGRPQVRIERPAGAPGPADRYLGDAAQLRALANVLAVPLSDLDDQIRRTAAGLGV